MDEHDEKIELKKQLLNFQVRNGFTLRKSKMKMAAKKSSTPSSNSLMAPETDRKTRKQSRMQLQRTRGVESSPRNSLHESDLPMFPKSPRGSLHELHASNPASPRGSLHGLHPASFFNMGEIFKEKNSDTNNNDPNNSKLYDNKKKNKNKNSNLKNQRNRGASLHDMHSSHPKVVLNESNRHSLHEMCLDVVAMTTAVSIATSDSMATSDSIATNNGTSVEISCASKDSYKVPVTPPIFVLDTCDD